MHRYTLWGTCMCVWMFFSCPIGKQTSSLHAQQVFSVRHEDVDCFSCDNGSSVSIFASIVLPVAPQLLLLVISVLLASVFFVNLLLCLCLSLVFIHLFLPLCHLNCFVFPSPLLCSFLYLHFFLFLFPKITLLLPTLDVLCLWVTQQSYTKW